MEIIVLSIVLAYCVNIHLNISSSRNTSDLHPEERNGPQSLSQPGLKKMMDA